MASRKERDREVPGLPVRFPATEALWPSYDPRRYRPTAATYTPGGVAAWDLVRDIAVAAQERGWKVYCEPLRHRQHVLPYDVPGDPGFPHLVLARPPRLLFAEVSERETPIDPQTQAWFSVLGRYPFVEVHHWTVEDWLDGTVLSVLEKDKVVRWNRSRKKAQESVVGEDREGGGERKASKKTEQKSRKKRATGKRRARASVEQG